MIAARCGVHGDGTVHMLSRKMIDLVNEQRRRREALRQKAERHLVAQGEATKKHHEGDMDHYTDEALRAREKMRHHCPEIQEAIGLWWQSATHLDENDDGLIDFTEYCRFHQLLVDALTHDEGESHLHDAEVEDVLLQDWEQDSAGTGHLDYDRFFECVFGLADHWCDTLDPREYTSYLLRSKSNRTAALSSSHPPPLTTDISFPTLPRQCTTECSQNSCTSPQEREHPSHLCPRRSSHARASAALPARGKIARVQARRPKRQMCPARAPRNPPRRDMIRRHYNCRRLPLLQHRHPPNSSVPLWHPRSLVGQHLSWNCR